MSAGAKVVRFDVLGRKSKGLFSCSVCGCSVESSSLCLHALWHVRKDEATEHPNLMGFIIFPALWVEILVADGVAVVIR